MFQELKPLAHPITVRCALGTAEMATLGGYITLRSPDNSTFRLHALYVPGMQHNLRSADVLRQEKLLLRATLAGWELREVSGKLVSNGIQVSGELNQVLLDLVTVQPGQTINTQALATAATADGTAGNPILWHQRLGHPAQESLARLTAHNLMTGMRVVNHPVPKADSPCPGCVASKAKQQIFRSRPEASKQPLNIVHGDLLSPLVMSWDKKQYILVMVDQYSRYLWAYPLNSKGDAAGVIKRWHMEVNTQTGVQLRIFRMDRGFRVSSWVMS